MLRWDRICIRSYSSSSSADVAALGPSIFWVKVCLKFERIPIVLARPQPCGSCLYPLFKGEVAWLFPGWKIVLGVFSYLFFELARHKVLSG